MKLRGVIKWLEMTGAGQYNLGVRLDRPMGDSDGTNRHGKRYFTVQPKYGLFCTSAVVTYVLRRHEQTGQMEKIRFEPGDEQVQRQAKAYDDLLMQNTLWQHPAL